MKKLLLLFFCIPILISAQVTDDFEDGNFTSNPSWNGLVNKFKVNTSKQLQLDDTMEDEAFLATASSFLGDAEWKIWVKLGFSPSSNNNARIYLVSDQEDVSGSLNGYFLQLGESGSSDAIELFRQEGESVSSVCRGIDGLLSSAFEIRIKVTRNEIGLWQIYADPLGGENFQLQCEATDNTFDKTNYFGVFCKYTISNSTKFYFDDIYAGPKIIDTQAPEIIALVPETDTTLNLTFSEFIDSLSLININNYSVNKEIGNPEKILPDEVNKKNVKLVFGNQFDNGEVYKLTVSGIVDLAGNEMETTELNFSFYRPNSFDVVINEIMADPTPAVGLPDCEYLELYNQTSFPINLDNWVLTIGSSEKYFENVIIESGGFLLVADSEAEAVLNGFGAFYGFDSFTLTNSGQSITLTAKNEEIISQIIYSDDWYQNLEKEDGGWSLEQINPKNMCSGKDNWKASENPAGGTPGKINSVFQDVLILPKVLRLEMVSERKLQIYFSQKMDLSLLSDPENYFVDHEVGHPEMIDVDPLNPEFADLTFPTSFLSGTVYKITIHKNLENCISLPIVNDTTLQFGIGEIPLPDDLVINEILFNPWTNGVDFVEVYNKSSKVLDLSKLLLGTAKISPPNPIDTTCYSVTGEQFLMVPNSYFVLTSSAEAIKNFYYTPNPAGFIRMEKFPAYNNDQGICLLENSSGELIDAFDYSEEMHYPLLNYHDGVSLERVSFNSPTQDALNWHSAAESVGFATPAYENSQFIPPGDDSDEISIEPELFSPDNDGYHDLLGIQYNFGQPGYSMTVNIYNSEGHKVKQLVNNHLIGAGGVLNWDGIQDDNSKAPVGIYILYIRVFDVKGNMKQFKKTAVLASRL